MAEGTGDRLGGAAPESGVPADGISPRFSVVIPIHNEAECLAEEVGGLVRQLEARAVDYEILLVENGSSDRTPEIARALAGGSERIRALRLSVPDYGGAMKAGMLAGRGDLITVFDIDLYDVDFMLKAGVMLEGAEPNAGLAQETDTAPSVAPSMGTATGFGAGIVVGSKLVAGAEDRRSFARHLVSLGFTTILRLMFDRHMDDTHGMKVLRREIVERYAPETVMTRDLFDTELIIRARRGGVVVKAVPVTVEEKRKPRSSIVRRIPRTIRGLVRLRMVLWEEGRTGS